LVEGVCASDGAMRGAGDGGMQGKVQLWSKRWVGRVEGMGRGRVWKRGMVEWRGGEFGCVLER
jgi:hypothetical protein